MTKERKQLDLYFNEPRLLMSGSGRIFVRVFGNIAYGLLVASSIILSLTDIKWLRSLGVLIILFLLDRLAHLGRPERSLKRLPKSGSLNAAQYFSPISYRLVEAAYDRALASGGNFTIYLLRFLIMRKDIQAAFQRMGVKPEEFSAKLDEYLNSGAELKQNRTELNQEVSFISEQALRESLFGSDIAIQPVDLFASAAKLKEPFVVKIMNVFNIEDFDLENALIFARLGRGSKRGFSFFKFRHRKVRHRVVNRSWTSRATPFLDSVSEDLTDLARSGSLGFLVGHEKEYEHLVDIISRPGNPNALLVGDPGSGKNAVVGHLAFQITVDQVPAALFDKRLVSLSLGSLAAGRDEQGVQARTARVIDEILKSGNIILYIPDMHNLFIKGSGFEQAVAQVLFPIIKSSAFSVIGGTYPKEFKQYIESVSDFSGTFETVRVEEINENEAVKFLTIESLTLENQTKITISFKAIKEAAILAHRFFRQKLLPGSASDVLKEALSYAAQKGSSVLEPEDVQAVVERRVNVPVHELKGQEVQKLLDLEKIIHEKMIDQEEAVKAVSQAMREYRSGLARKGGPIASFLFVGPTGVGKTELAKTLTRIQFGKEDLMARFDMSEYQDKQSFFRFIGSPDGSVRGALTDAVLETPYKLILLDEFEKAHPDILNLFLQVFDDGRLTDNLGRRVDFQNTIIIATSNAHSEFIKTEIENGTPTKEVSEQLKKKLTDFFKAELLNRFSEIIVFKPLSASDIGEVAKIQLSELAKIVMDNQGIELNFADSAVNEIARLGFDPVFGARPLRKVISDKIRSELADKLLRKEINRGSKVNITFENEIFRFNQ